MKHASSKNMDTYYSRKYRLEYKPKQNMFVLCARKKRYELFHAPAKIKKAETFWNYKNRAQILSR